MLRKLSLQLDSILEKLKNPLLFCTLFNFRNFFTSKRFNRSTDYFVRLKYNKAEKFLKVIGSKDEIFVSDLVLANHTYKFGLGNRANEIGQTYLLNLIKFKNGDLIVDCGANMGDLYLYFKKNKIDIRYIAFEPSPKDFECLKRNIPATQRTYNLGLWDFSDSINFYVSSAGADSSFIRPTKFDEIINVKTERLDNLVSQKIKLLKVEAEGGEPEVLRGCTNILKNIEYISVDAGPERGVKAESTLEYVINYCLSNNFELIKLTHNRVIALFKNKF